MRRIVMAVMLAFFVVPLSGCPSTTAVQADGPNNPEESRGRDGNQMRDDDPSASDRPIPGYQPTYSLNIIVKKSDPPRYEVLWSADVNTGGWLMRTDNVDFSDGIARVYIDLEKPAPDELVTQAFERIPGRFDAGETPVESAELHVRRRVRGEVGPDASFQLVKTTSR